MASSRPRSADATVTALPTLAPYPPELHEIVVAIRAMAARQKLGSERAVAVALKVKRHQLRRALSAMRTNRELAPAEAKRKPLVGPKAAKRGPATNPMDG